MHQLAVTTALGRDPPLARFLPMREQQALTTCPSNPLEFATMKQQDRHFRFFAVIALALAAGAIRMEERWLEPQGGVIGVHPRPQLDDIVRCDTGLDPSWIGACTHPRHVLTVSR